MTTRIVATSLIAMSGRRLCRLGPRPIDFVDRYDAICRHGSSHRRLGIPPPWPFLPLPWSGTRNWWPRSPRCATGNGSGTRLFWPYRSRTRPSPSPSGGLLCSQRSDDHAATRGPVTAVGSEPTPLGTGSPLLNGGSEGIPCASERRSCSSHTAGYDQVRITAEAFPREVANCGSPCVERVPPSAPCQPPPYSPAQAARPAHARARRRTLETSASSRPRTT